MRIYKKHPFSAPNSVKVNKLASKCEQLEKTMEDLQVIRQHIVDGTMTEELYDFINMDGCLNNIMPGLPRPSDEMACEALAHTQIIYLDAAMESVAEKWKQAIHIMWDALKEFLLDWIDDNRYIRINLQHQKAEYTVTPNVYGSVKSFASTTGNVYHKPYWEEMLSGCELLNEIIGNLPSGGDLSEWIESKLIDIQTAIKPFGHSISQPGPRLITGTPRYDKNVTTLDAARWRFNLLGQDMDRCIKCLGDEIQYRKLFYSLERIFNHAAPEQRTQLAFVRQLVMLSKCDVLVVARGLRAVLNAAKRTA